MTDDELDRLAAELIMGWHVSNAFGGIIPEVWRDESCKVRDTIANWRPTRNPAQCEMVMRRAIDERGWAFRLEHFGDSWLCEWRKPDPFTRWAAPSEARRSDWKRAVIAALVAAAQKEA